MATEIKTLTIDDYDAIINIWDMAGLPTKQKGRDSRELFAKEMALDQVAIYGLFLDNEMIGVGMANWDGRRGWINRVAIHPDHRGHAYAGIIVRECKTFLKDCGALAICALIEEMNSPSLTCFQKEGLNCNNDIVYLCEYAFEGA